MKTDLMKSASFIFIMGAFILSGCSKPKSHQNQPIDTTSIICDFKEDTINKTDYILFAEQAVNAWFYYNLPNFASYQRLSAKIDYNSNEDCYYYQCRYKTMNVKGGYETFEKSFRVELDIDNNGAVKDYHVQELTEN